MLTESDAPAAAADDSKSGTPPASRLVIRVKITADSPPPPPPVEPRLSRGALLLIAVAVAALLGWAGISMFGGDPPTASSEAAPVISYAKTIPKPATTTAEIRPAEAKPVEAEVRPPPDVPLSPVNEVLPNASRSALDTIRGTIRVSVGVIVDKQGSVLSATADDRGPSRYFERIAIEAAKKWTFTPASSAEQRTVLIRFNFTRDGATARADLPG